MPNFTIAIISGGKSSRMGTDKGLLEIGGKAMIEQIVAQTAGWGGETIVITNTPPAYSFLGLPMFPDILPDKGALGGLFTAISSASQPYALALACDMPFVSRPLLEHMLSLARFFDAVVPRVGGEAEPFRAVYGKACLLPIQRALGAGKMRVISFFPEIRLRWIEEDEIKQFDPELLTFMNCNTPEELEEVREIWTRRPLGSRRP